MTHNDLAAHARTVLDTNRYLTLGTVDPNGNPWTTPVYFAPANEWEYYWLSATDAEHSRNLVERPRVSVVVFDSTVEPYHGQAVYAVGEARELSGSDVDRGLEVYPGPNLRGGTQFTRDDVTGPTGYRLYRAVATDLWVLCPSEHKQPCPLHGIRKDHRARVTPPHNGVNGSSEG